MGNHRHLYTLDCEFIEDGHTIDLISIGLVCEDGRQYYAESTEANLDLAGDWVRENVFPKMHSLTSGSKPMVNRTHPDAKSREQIRDEILEFLREYAAWPQIWAWYGAYDHVALCQLWGPMVDLPKRIPHLTRDLRQEWDRQARPPLPEQFEPLHHHALWDARHDMAYAHVLGLVKGALCPLCKLWFATEEERNSHYRLESLLAGTQPGGVSVVVE